MATFGNTSTTTNAQDGDWANYKVASMYALGEAGLVSKLTIRCMNGASACHLTGLIYSDSSTQPNVLLATGSDVAIAANVAAGWLDLPLAVPVALDAGNYWLGFIGDSGATTFNTYELNATGSNVYSADTYAGGAANPFGAQSDFAKQFIIYATYSVPAAEAATICPAMTGRFSVLSRVCRGM